MAATRTTSASTAATAISSPPRWYAAAVVGLALFLVALLLGHPPIAGYQAQMSVSRMPTAAPGPAAFPPAAAVDFAEAQDWLTHEATLRQVAEQAGLDGCFPKGSSHAERLAQLRKNLQLLPSTDGDSQQWVIQYVGRDRQAAERLAHEAAEAFAGYLDRVQDTRPREAELAALRRAVQAGHDEEGRLQGEIEQLRHEQLALVLRREREAAPAISPAVASTNTVNAAGNRLQRDQLIETIEALQIDHGQLLANLQPTHPRVAALNAQIEQLQQQLRQPSLNEADITPADNREAGGLQLEPSASVPRGRTAAQFASLSHTTELDPAINVAARLEGAQQLLRTVGEQRQDAETRLDAALQLAALPWQKQWQAETVSSPQRIGGTPRSQDILFAGLFAIVAATAMTIDWNWFQRLRVLVTAAQTRKLIAAPLLAEIALPEGRPAPPAGENSPRKRLVLHAAEWFLIAAVALLFLAAISQRELAAQLAHDPFGAMAEAFDNWRTLSR